MAPVLKYFLMLFLIFYVATALIFFGLTNLNDDSDLARKDAIWRYRQQGYLDYRTNITRQGPREDQKEYILPADEQVIADKLFKNASFIVYASDKIALDRSIPDTRTLV